MNEENPEKIKVTEEDIERIKITNADFNHQTSDPTSNFDPKSKSDPNPQKSAKNSISLKVAVVTCVVIALGLIVYSLSRSSLPEELDKPLEPMEVVEKIDSIEFASNLPLIREYCTFKGYNLLEWSSENEAENDPTVVPSYGKPMISGQNCDIPFSMQTEEGRMVGHIRLLQQDGWKFDDFFIKSLDGKKIELYVSYMKDHPVKTFFKVNWKDMALGFLKGLAIGYGAGV